MKRHGCWIGDLIHFSRKLLLTSLYHHGRNRCHSRGSGDETLLFFNYGEYIVIVICRATWTVSSQITSGTLCRFALLAWLLLSHVVAGRISIVLGETLP